MTRFAFARTPKWIFGHLIVLALVVTFVNAGLWQLRRLHQRRAFNAEVELNMAMPVTPFESVLGKSASFTDVTHQLDRRVSLTGHYLIDQEFVIGGQSNNSVPGVWSVTPLRLDDGRVVLVNRGWIPSTGQITAASADARPPTGKVRVVGLISETQAAVPGESVERRGSHLTSFVRIDIARIQRQFSQPLAPAFVQRSSQSPSDSGSVVPETLPAPQLTDGPHLSYAMQWFSFTLLALVAYPILLVAVARDREKKERGDEDGPDPLPEGAFVDEDGVVDMTGVAPRESSALS